VSRPTCQNIQLRNCLQMFLLTSYTYRHYNITRLEYCKEVLTQTANNRRNVGSQAWLLIYIAIMYCKSKVVTCIISHTMFQSLINKNKKRNWNPPLRIEFSEQIRPQSLTNKITYIFSLYFLGNLLCLILYAFDHWYGIMGEKFWLLSELRAYEVESNSVRIRALNLLPHALRNIYNFCPLQFFKNVW
jgi:hypothetical protein